jgi:uncharacterized protein (DUF433 family)
MEFFPWLEYEQVRALLDFGQRKALPTNGAVDA